MAWVSSSNNSFNLRLVRTTGEETHDARTADFHPAFTYPIFGEEEKIYGYIDLLIELRFASGSLAQYLSITSTKSIPKPDDVEGTLYKFIPPDYLKNDAEFAVRVENDADEFRPMGKKIHTYARPSPANKGKSVKHVPRADDIEYEVYHATWDTPGFREYHRRMQLFILLFIEGGSYIQEDEEKWEFVVLYEKTKNEEGKERWHFIGYSSLYPFWAWPDKTRLRLSQFVILPPYQSGGHGSQLYSAIYSLVLSTESIVELTVEDPSEAFEDLRDHCDLDMLRARDDFIVGWPGGGKKGQGEGWTAPVNKEWEKKWRADLKLAKRQFQRLVEILILDHLHPRDGRADTAFRLQVKERLYRFNFEILSQLDKDERLEKLEDTYSGVREDYTRLLQGRRRSPPPRS